MDGNGLKTEKKGIRTREKRFFSLALYIVGADHGKEVFDSTYSDKKNCLTWQKSLSFAVFKNWWYKNFFFFGKKLKCLQKGYYCM